MTPINLLPLRAGTLVVLSMTATSGASNRASTERPSDSIYDKSGSLLTRDDATTSQVTDHISLGGQTFVRVTNGTPTYPLNDHLGSAYMVADQNGGVSAANTFDIHAVRRVGRERPR